ncbi:acyltransferase family protein [Brevibacillus laterosporus]
MKQFRNQTSKRYIPGLDGLRALSVLAVIAYHLNGKWAQGGLLGVGIFFVISGYLITDQIVTEWKQFQKLRLLHFWVRRARRLLPVLICMLLFVASWVDPGRLFALKGIFFPRYFT